MNYEKFRYGGKTPNEHLLVCDKCQHARWFPRIYEHQPTNVQICSACDTKYREATEKEKQEALDYLDPLSERKTFWERTFKGNPRNQPRWKPKAMRKLERRNKK